LAVGVKGAAGGGFGFFHRIAGEEVGDFGDEASAGESLFDVVAFEIDIGIDFMGDAIVALVALESDIVSGGTYPQHPATDFKWRFPDA